MDTDTRLPAPFRATKGLAYLGGFFGYGVGLSALYAVTGIGLPCPFRSLTGWECPLCGGTRLGSALLHGDLVVAFLANPVVFLGLGVLTVLGVLWTVEALGGRAVRLPDRWSAPVLQMRPTHRLFVVLAASVVFVVLRHLL